MKEVQNPVDPFRASRSSVPPLEKSHQLRHPGEKVGDSVECFQENKLPRHFRTIFTTFTPTKSVPNNLLVFLLNCTQ